MSSSTTKVNWLAPTGIMLIQKTLYTRGKRQILRLYKLATMSKNNHYFMDIFQMSLNTMKENWLALTGNMLIQRTHIIKARKLMSVWSMLWMRRKNHQCSMLTFQMSLNTMRVNWSALTSTMWNPIKKSRVMSLYLLKETRGA